MTESPQSPDGAGGAPPAAPPPEPAAPSHRDWNGMATSIRELVSSNKELLAAVKLAPGPAPGKEQEKSAPLPVGTPANDPRVAEVDIKLALMDAEIKGPQRDALVLMWNGAGRPTENLSEWVTKHRALLGAAPAVVPPVVPPVPPRAPSDTGPPVSVLTADGKPQGHPLSWPIELVTKMKPEEYRTAIKEFEDKGGSSSVNKYFDERRRAAEERRKQR